MKKLSLLFILGLAFGALVQSCDNSKTYAEMLEDERAAISRFIKKHNITTITQAEFEVDTVTGANEYVLFDNGVYLHIEDRGEGDTIKSRDEILVRMKEYNVMAEYDTTVDSDTLSNVEYDRAVDAFFYTRSGSTASGQWLLEGGGMGWYYYSYYRIYNSAIDVPPGLLFVLSYLKNNAHIQLIVPSKMGHNISSRYVHPYYYDIRKVQIRFGK